jgi:hypothetical protein
MMIKFIFFTVVIKYSSGTLEKKQLFFVSSQKIYQHGILISLPLCCFYLLVSTINVLCFHKDYRFDAIDCVFPENKFLFELVEDILLNGHYLDKSNKVSKYKIEFNKNRSKIKTDSRCKKVVERIYIKY